MGNLKEVVTVSGAWLPVGSFGGSLKGISAIDMGAVVVREAVKRTGIEPSDISETIVGQVGQTAECGFVARAVNLKVRLPKPTCAYSVNRQCGLGLQAAADAVMEIQTGFADVVIAAGTENISQLPCYVKDARWSARMRHKVFEDGVIDILTWPLGPCHDGVTAESVAEKYNVTCQKQDQCALESHLKAAAAIEAGKFKGEILPVELKDRKGDITVFDTGESPRTSQTIEKLEHLKPCFVKGETVATDNSSNLNDGVAAVIVMSREETNALGVRPPLTIKGYTVADNDGVVMGYAPRLSSEKLATELRSDLKATDMFGVNEAFASRAFVVRRNLGLGPNKANIYNGRISIDHPIGATGAILAVKVFYGLQRTGKEDAMVSMCIGGEQGISMYFTKD